MAILGTLAFEPEKRFYVRVSSVRDLATEALLCTFFFLCGRCSGVCFAHLQVSVDILYVHTRVYLPKVVAFGKTFSRKSFQAKHVRTGLLAVTHNFWLRSNPSSFELGSGSPACFFGCPTAVVVAADVGVPT